MPILPCSCFEDSFMVNVLFYDNSVLKTSFSLAPMLNAHVTSFMLCNAGESKSFYVKGHLSFFGDYEDWMEDVKSIDMHASSWFGHYILR